MYEMKPIEKYKQKFIDLLKEAEEELGGGLRVEVSSSMMPMPSISATYPPEPTRYEKVYGFSIATNGGNKPFWVG